jgi:arabinan endo-1,5-alpha-L-arabinosidase
MRKTCTIALALMAIALATAAPAALAYPAPGTVTGYTITHDPSMLVRDSAPRYVVYSTHNQSSISQDRISFSNGGPIFPVKPAWWTLDNLSGDLWAPDASFHNGKYWLYYAVSQGSGAGHSSIGVATSTSGLPGTWTDSGAPIITSRSGDGFNAIDPNLLVDAQGRWWLTFGSFWGGIYITELNPATGKPTTNPLVKTNIAQRFAPPASDPIEGATIYQRGGYYYLFASFDYCCRGAGSNYSIHFGRSTSPTGPYVDAAGASMLQGGGTLLLKSHDFVTGPGGQSVVRDSAGPGHDLLVYHYYDSRLNYEPFLGINFLGWDAAGWPYVY